MRKTHLDIILAFLGFLALMVFHVDFWRSPSTDLYFGWLPEALAYRLGWIAAAWLYLLFFCARIWSKET